MRFVLTCLGVSVLILLAWGLIVLASAGGENGFRLHSDANYFIVRQMIWLAVSLPCFFVALKFDYHKWKEMPGLIIATYVIISVCLVLVFFFPKINGSQRWVNLGPLRLQPSEFAKLLAIIATAVFIDWSGWAIRKFVRGALGAALIAGFLMGLILIEPDFGATMVIGFTTAALFLVGGVKVLHMVALGVLGGGVVATVLAFNPNRMNRIFSWVKSSQIGEFLGFASATDASAILSDKEQAAAHQVDMALVALRNGGLTGVGMNKSMQKLRYLPESHTDFIFAIGAEEWGLIFSLSLLVLFMVVFVCGMIISARAPDSLGRLMAYGITFLIFFQVVFNIGVVTKCLPTKGLALPFISYGGTNLLSAMMAVGILFNIGLQIELPKTRPRSTI